MGHIVNAEGFEVLSAFKSNCGMGRAMPKLVEGRALGVAAVWASRVGKRIEEGELLLREAAKGMYKKQPRMQFGGHGFGNSAHDPWVIPADASHSGASAGTEMCAHMCACNVHQRLHNLHWACDTFQLELISIVNGPCSVHTHAIVMQLLQEQPDGSSGGSNSGFPRLVRSIARGEQATNHQDKLDQH